MRAKDDHVFLLQLLVRRSWWWCDFSAMQAALFF